MVLLFVGLALTVLMVYITRQLHSELSPEHYRRIMALLIPAYLLTNWVFTLFTRTPGECTVVLVPLRAYIKMLGWDVQTFAELFQLLGGTWEGSAEPTLSPLVGVAQNIVLFLPFGFLLRAANSRLSTGKILLLGFALSLFIESSQLIFQLGWFETDDIMHNVLGTYAGIRLYRRCIDE